VLKKLRYALLTFALLLLHLYGRQFKYFVYQSMSTNVGTSVEKIQVLRDARLRGIKRIPLDIDGPQAVTYTPALLRLIDSSGKKLEVHQLSKPMAWIKGSMLDGPGPTFEVTEDFSTGFGTYNGPMTSFVSIGSGKLQWLEASDPDGRNEHVIQFLDSIRSVWRVKNPTTILAAFAQPDKKGTGGTVRLSRYSYEKDHWVEHSVTKSGPSEFEATESIPADSEYP
jgi:hypothetical protein